MSGGGIMENKDRNPDRDTGFNIGHMILRIFITSLVIAIAAYLTPGFTIEGMGSLLLAAVVIGVLDHLVQMFTGVDASPFGKGIAGFLVAAIILYLTKFIVPGFNISIVGAIIGAIVIGIVDAILPGKGTL